MDRVEMVLVGLLLVALMIFPRQFKIFSDLIRAWVPFILVWLGYRLARTESRVRELERKHAKGGAGSGS